MNIRRLIFVGAFATGLAGIASASSMVVNCSVVSGPTELNNNIACNQFNALAGQTLNSIDLTITGSINGYINLINNDPRNTAVISGTTTSQFLLNTALAGFAFSPNLFSTSFSSGSHTVPVNTTQQFGSFSSATASASATDSTTFAPYIGQSTFNIAVATSTGITAFGGNGNSGATDTTSGTATAVVTYNYSATNPTPEPTTMLLFGTGLIGLGLLRKRIKS